MSDTDLLVTSQVAEQYKVHPSTVMRWAKAGLLRGAKTPGGSWRFLRSDVDEFFESIRAAMPVGKEAS